MSLFSRSDQELPGITAVVREVTHSPKQMRKLAAGEIAVIDGPVIGRAQAQKFIDLQVAAVVTVYKAEDGVIPRFAPQLLIDAGITFVDGIGTAARESIRSGKKYRLNDGTLYHGSSVVAQGREITLDDAIHQFNDSRERLVDHMEAFSGNLTEFVQSEAPLFIDGLGIPDVDTAIVDRKTVIVSPGEGHEAQLAELKAFIREYDPVLIGVDEGTDTLLEAGYKPDIIVGFPQRISDKGLRCGALVVLPADPDGHAAGLERIQDLGVGAMTFPAATDSASDLALLLTAHHGASLIVNCGATFDLMDLFDENQRDIAASALLTRQHVGRKLIDASAVEELYLVRTSGSGWPWAILGILIAIAVIILIAGFGGDDTFVNNLISTWNNIALGFQYLFKN